MPATARRRFLSLVAGLAGGLLPFFSRAQHHHHLPHLVAELTKGAEARPGRVTVDTPLLADNGHSVPVTLRVASPMTEADHVRSITLFAEKNPRPVIATFRLGPRAGRAEVATRIRLNGTQRLLAVAELSDGSYWSGEAEVVVTENACVDES